MEELKPCPFCEGEALLLIKGSLERGTTRGWEFGIYCSECNVTTAKTNYRLEIKLGDLGHITEIVDERQMAAEAWNRRADHVAD